VPWTTDPDGRFVTPQPAWSAYTGQSWEDYRDFGRADALHPGDRDRVRAVWQHAVATGTPYESRGRLWHAPEQRYRYFVARATPLQEPDGAVREWIGTVTDVHDRQLAEDALRESEVKFRTLFDHSPLPKWAFEADTLRFVDVNEAALRHDGYSREEFLRMTVLDVRTPEAGEALAAILARSPRDLPKTDVCQHRKKNGEVIDVEVHWSQISLADTRVWLAAVNDITERKRTEAFMASQRQAFEMAALDAPLLQVMELLARGIEANSQYRVMVAVHLLDACGERFERSVAPSLPDAYRQATDGMHVASAAGPCGAAILGRRPIAIPDVLSDGRFPEFVSFAAALGIRAGRSTPIVSSTGAVLGTIAYYYREARESSPQDELLGDIATRTAAVIIERRQADEALRHVTEDLRQANGVKEEFLAILSHELRTPLNAMLGWSQMLRAGALKPDVQQRALESLERNAKAQAQLVDDLLDVSRVVAGKLSIRTDAVDLVKVVTAALDTVRPSASIKGIHLRVDVASVDALSVTGDEDRLRQIVWNLLSNAIKFTPGGGHVRVSLRRANSSAEIVVTDTGQGIDPAFLPHVFERFRQADTASTRRHTGLGLGLSLVRYLTEAHGGAVSVASPGPGQGATFTVQLPIRPATPAGKGDGQRTPHADWPSLDGIRALVVDDEHDTRDMVRFVLETVGAEVTTAESAGAALHEFARRPFDVVVADIALPERDGYWLIRAIRDLPSGRAREIPGIAVTAYASTRDRDHAIEAGFDFHLAKPIEPEQLVAVVASATDSRKESRK